MMKKTTEKCDQKRYQNEIITGLTLKPTIHNSWTWANMTNRGTKLFFRRIKYCWRKRDKCVALHCSLFAVNFSCGRRFFFSTKKFFVFDANPAYSVWRKTCSQNMANAFYRLFAVRRFFVISPLFRYCSRIVYSGLKDEKCQFDLTSFLMSYLRLKQI